MVAALLKNDGGESPERGLCGLGWSRRRLRHSAGADLCLIATREHRSYGVRALLRCTRDTRGEGSQYLRV